MNRFRILAAIFACLAVLASGFMTVAAIAAPLGAPMTESGASNPPCSHCDDCDGMPCPMPAASCPHVSSSATPILVVSAVDMPAIVLGEVLWSAVAMTLTGLSQPPDPFPPRV